MASTSNEDDRVFKNVIKFIEYLTQGEFQVRTFQRLEISKPEAIENLLEKGYDSMPRDSSGALRDENANG